MDALVAAAAVVDGAAIAPPPHPRSHTRLSEAKRWGIVVLSEDKQPQKEVCRKLDVNRRAISRVLKRYRDTGTPASGSRSGRPRATSPDTEHAIELTARIDVFTTPRQVKRKLMLDVSPRTVDRVLQRAGLFGRVARCKRDYSPVEVRKRLSFANGYGGHDADWWERVLFSDEKCFYGKGFCGQTWVRRPKGAALKPEYCVHKAAHPVKVNVWACFGAGGQGYTYIFNGIMDAQLMRRIVRDNVKASAQLLWDIDAHPGMWYLLHDNDKKFNSNIVTEYLHENGISKIDFPPYSPDLNPIENLWATMQRAVEKHACETMEALQDAVAEEWGKLDKRHMRNLARSMPERCAAVIAAAGWHTDY